MCTTSEFGDISTINSNRIHVILSVESISDSYNQHAGVTLTSILSNSSYPITAHILYCKLDNNYNTKYQYHLSKYLELEKIYPGTKIDLRYVPFETYDTPLKEYFSTHPKVQLLSPAASLRCFAPEILHDVEWAIYLDTDIIVQIDLAELWKTLDKYKNISLLGCLDEGWDFWPHHNHTIHKKYGLSKTEYINSGVLVMNLKKIRDTHDLNLEIQPYLKSKPKLPFYDQDIINLIFNGDIEYLPSMTYNSMVGLYPERDLSKSIMHFADSKPWKSFDYKYHYYYWKYLLDSPWGDVDTIYQLIDNLTNKRIIDRNALQKTLSKKKRDIIKFIKCHLDSLISKV